MAAIQRARREMRCKFPDSYTDHRAVVAERIRLRRVVRANQLAASAPLLGMSVPSWSPIRAWQNAIKSPFNAECRRAQALLAALEERFPTPEPWKPRPLTAADRKIAKLYKPAIKATPINYRFFRVLDADWYAERHEHKHRRRIDAQKRRDDAREHAEWIARRDRVSPCVAA